MYRKSLSSMSNNGKGRGDEIQAKRNAAQYPGRLGPYTSYPLLLEGFDEPPYILADQTNLFPFTCFFGGSIAVFTSILFNLWWFGLTVIAAVRLPRRHF